MIVYVRMCEYVCMSVCVCDSYTDSLVKPSLTLTIQQYYDVDQYMLNM